MPSPAMPRKTISASVPIPLAELVERYSILLGMTRSELLLQSLSHGIPIVIKGLCAELEEQEQRENLLRTDLGQAA